MATYTVTDDLIRSPSAEDYFCNADRRVVIGLRATLEMLGIPVPDYATRKPPGRHPAKHIMAAYDGDHPKYRPLEYRPPKPRKST